MRCITAGLFVAAALAIPACRSQRIKEADREVFALIEDRQNAALGIAHAIDTEAENGQTAAGKTMESTNPRPLDAAVPQAFQTRQVSLPPAATEPNEDAPDVAQEGDPDDADLIPLSIFTDDELPNVQLFSLQDALTYATRHARELQDAKEDLYLAALDLSLERHLWTPQFVASVNASFDDRPDTEDPTRAGIMLQDRAMQTVSEVSLRQRLPYGGEITASVLHTLMRDVTDHVEKGETGAVILEANVPLLRGAGRAAQTHESLLSSERNLIYAVRDYERFRRRFLVNIAADYFNLQQNKASTANTYNSYLNRRQDWEKADFIERMGRSRTIAEAPRAKANFRNSETGLVSAKERYETALDRFKIRIAMPVDTLLDVVEQEKDEESKVVDSLLPDVSGETAHAIALAYRLDLLNSADTIDDRRRGVRNAENRILPDLDLTGGMTANSDDDQLRPTHLREERLSWRGGINFRLDDRKAERNAYRRSLISLRAAQRDHEELNDSVRADVRRALRQIAQQENLRMIHALNVQENSLRLEGARQQLELGRSRTNQDVVDAENDLLRAKNDLAAAIAEYRIAILEFRLDTGTLRITDDGRWVTADIQEGLAPPDDNARDGG